MKMRFIYSAPLLILGVLPLACSSTFTMGPSKPPTSMPTSTPIPVPTFTPTFTYTSCSLCTPTFTGTSTNTSTATATSTNTSTPTFTGTSTNTPTITNTPNVPPTFTLTPNGTTIPMGPVVVAAFDGSIINYTILGYSISATVSGATAGISYNRLADATAAVTLITPSNGSIPLTWIADQNMGTYTLSQYSSSTTFTYTPNAVYSIAVYDTWGNASSSMNAPGQITFNANGSSVTAAYPGNYDQAQVQESAPVPQTIFVSTAGVNVGSPYNYPVTAYPNSGGVTYATTYSAGLTISTFTGSPGAWGAFVGNQSLSDTFTR